jgi:putative transposase
MQAQEQAAREMRGKLICESSGTNVKRIDEHEYRVKSQSGSGEYRVYATEKGWLCSCPDFVYREKCKHIFAVEFSKTLRRAVENAVLAPIIATDSCIFCGSAHIVKDGVRHNKRADIQKYVCLQCERYFTINLGFERMRNHPEVITQAMQLYFTGESLRNVQKFLRMQGVAVSHIAVLKWIRKYVGLMEKYLAQIQPNVSDTWRTDEMYVKFSGNMKYLFTMMDDETRFRISQMVADHKGTSDVRPMFKAAIQTAGKVPKTFISDGANNFHDAYRKEMWSPYGETPSPVHVRHIRLAGDMNNNKMERQNGEVRDREKTMRGLKNPDSPILKGYQIFHNYLRPHMGLDGKTPAEACGIEVKGDNKWLTIIQNASKANI